MAKKALAAQRTKNDAVDEEADWYGDYTAEQWDQWRYGFAANRTAYTVGPTVHNHASGRLRPLQNRTMWTPRLQQWHEASTESGRSLMPLSTRVTTADGRTLQVLPENLRPAHPKKVHHFDLTSQQSFEVAASKRKGGICYSAGAVWLRAPARLPLSLRTCGRRLRRGKSSGWRNGAQWWQRCWTSCTWWSAGTGFFCGSLERTEDGSLDYANHQPTGDYGSDGTDSEGDYDTGRHRIRSRPTGAGIHRTSRGGRATSTGDSASASCEGLCGRVCCISRHPSTAGRS